MSQLLRGAGVIRPYDPEQDQRFLWDSWSKSFKHSRYAGVVRNIDYHAATVSVIEDLLRRGAVVEVVCARHRPDQILGYVCWEALGKDRALHYVYVKDPFRQEGLATALLERIRAAAPQEARLYHTFRTEDFDRRLNRDGAWSHAPEIARRKG